jgi:hypothetical protein
LAAVGAVSAASLTACGGLHGLFGSEPANSDIPAVGGGDGTKYWYLFLWDSGAQKYQVWRTDRQPPSDPKTKPFDTADWYSVLQGIAGALTLQTRAVQPPVEISGHVYNTDDNGYLTSVSASTMQKNAALLKWLEVGYN